MPLNAADAQTLGNIINDLNPYYDAAINALPGVLPPGWQMDIDLATAAPGSPGIVSPFPNTVGPNVMLEVDDHYYGEWNFNGQPQKISRALRIRYRYPVSAPSGQVYWLEDYLLIGFEGADGGG
ncbi:MAG: hypothetical protein JO320_10245 [Alphaproteobacteria bacterium]|nr:hypothetical protein [Alphaproteobacteria bacterium]MBV9375420.1 hypothetical protein [Alphaproteobacteria bacterium]